MSPVLCLLVEKGIDHFVLHTDQHYSHNMNQVFFEQLQLEQPKYNLNVGSGTHGEETGKYLLEKRGVIVMQRLATNTG